MDLYGKFKEKEQENVSYVPNNSRVVMRLDGKNFKTFTKNFVRPYDINFSNTMDAVAEHLCNVITGTKFAYVQSDEISVFFDDLNNETTQMWLGGRINKMLTIAAANATAKYMRTHQTELFPIFDARLHTLENVEETADYVAWRRADATKNAITMAANTLYSHKFLEGKNTPERRDLLKGTELEILPEEFLYGRLVKKETYEDTVTYTNKKTNEQNITNVTRSKWVTVPATDENLKTVLI